MSIIRESKHHLAQFYVLVSQTNLVKVKNNNLNLKEWSVKTRRLNFDEQVDEIPRWAKCVTNKHSKSHIQDIIRVQTQLMRFLISSLQEPTPQNQLQVAH